MWNSLFIVSNTPGLFQVVRVPLFSVYMASERPCLGSGRLWAASEVLGGLWQAPRALASFCEVLGGLSETLVGLAHPLRGFGMPQGVPGWSQEGTVIL